MRNVIAIVVVFFSMSFSVSAQDHSEDIEGVKEACMDYIHTFYNADTTLAYKSIHPSLRKTGFSFNRKNGTYSNQKEMPFADLISLAKRWNATGKKTDENSPKKVEVFEVSDKTAVAKVEAVWGIDYMSLMKVDGKWMIVNVIWQSAPKFSVRE